MSYSRWGNSRWYTFHCSSDATKKEDEIFEICRLELEFEDSNIQYFSYKDIRDDLQGCLISAVKVENRVSKPEYQVTEEEIEELKSYMMQFMDDVDEDYKDKE